MLKNQTEKKKLKKRCKKMMKLTQNNLLNLWSGLLKHDYSIKREFKKNNSARISIN
jgi:hypothetical protein